MAKIDLVYIYISMYSGRHHSYRLPHPMSHTVQLQEQPMLMHDLLTICHK